MADPMTCGRCSHWARDMAEAYPRARGAIAIAPCLAPIPRCATQTEPMFDRQGEGCPCFVDAGSTFQPESLLTKESA